MVLGAGDIGGFVDGVGINGGNTVSVILVVYPLRPRDIEFVVVDSVRSTE